MIKTPVNINFFIMVIVFSFIRILFFLLIYIYSSATLLSWTLPFTVIVRKRVLPMLALEGLIAVFSLVLTAFGLGYAIGCNKTQK